MRRSALLLASIALAVFLASGVAVAEEKLDQENAGPLESYYDAEEFNSHYRYLGQSFTAGKSGELSKVSVRIEKSICGAGSSDLLYKDINVWISGFVRTVGTIQASQVPYRQCSDSWSMPPWTDVTLDPGNRPHVVSGREYRITLRPEPAPTYPSDPPDYYWYYNAFYYMGGGAYQDYIQFSGGGSGTGDLGHKDFLFRTYVDVPDSDGDGLANDVDQCDYDSGPESNNGCPLDIARPAGTVLINGGKLRTTTRAVTLGLNATDPAPGSGVASMRLMNAGGTWTAWQPYAESKGWKLTRGAGKKTVYAQYRDAAGNVSAKASDSITYRP